MHHTMVPTQRGIQLHQLKVENMNSGNSWHCFERGRRGESPVHWHPDWKWTENGHQRVRCPGGIIKYFVWFGSNISVEMLTIFVCVSGLPAADLGGSDELANMEDGRSLFHLCPHPSGGYFCTSILWTVVNSISNASSIGFILAMFCLGVVFLFAANWVQNEQSPNREVFKVNVVQ